jgi:hypothetical protein
MVEWPKGSGETRPRVDVIRELFTRGQAEDATEAEKEAGKIGRIAKELGVSYQIVYQATRPQRENGAPHDNETAEEGTEDLAADATEDEEDSFEDASEDDEEE